MPKKEVYDHLGNKYNSMIDLCDHYGISVPLYYKRARLGWSLEKILATPVSNDFKPHKCKDHLGNEYDSVSNMCKAYNIGVSTFQSRLKRGYNLKQALTNDSWHLEIYEYRGKKYSSIDSICRDYGFTRYAIENYTRKGMSLNEALDKVIENKSKVYTDPLGREFKTLKELCAAWGVDVKTVRIKLRAGNSLEEALRVNKNNRYEIKDHLGNTYKNKAELCRAYGITVGTLNDRLKAGMTIEQALTNRKSTVPIKCKDYKGIEYRSFDEMCRAYGKETGTVRSRIKSGYSLKDALTGETRKQRKGSITDPFGVEYESVAKMCKKYKVNDTAYGYRLDHGACMEEALRIIPNFSGDTGIRDVKIDSRITVISKFNDYYKISYNGYETLWTHDDILNYYRKHVFGSLKEKYYVNE